LVCQLFQSLDPDFGVSFSSAAEQIKFVIESAGWAKGTDGTWVLPVDVVLLTATLTNLNQGRLGDPCHWSENNCSSVRRACSTRTRHALPARHRPRRGGDRRAEKARSGGRLAIGVTAERPGELPNRATYDGGIPQFATSSWPGFSERSAWLGGLSSGCPPVVIVGSIIGHFVTMSIPKLLYYYPSRRPQE